MNMFNDNFLSQNNDEKLLSIRYFSFILAYICKNKRKLKYSKYKISFLIPLNPKLAPLPAHRIGEKDGAGAKRHVRDRADALSGTDLPFPTGSV